MKASECITVIDLGSHKITAISALREANGSYQLVALEEENSEGTIVRGVVENVKSVGDKIYKIVLKLNAKLQRRQIAPVREVYISLNGATLRSEVREELLEVDEEVVAEDVAFLNEKVKGAAPVDSACFEERSIGYYLDGIRDEEPVGKKCNRLTEEVFYILSKAKIKENLNEVFKEVHGVNKMHVQLQPYALSKVLLEGREKEHGVVLVNIGATTTGVSVFHEGVLQYYTVIPLGGNNITRDISSVGIPMKEAEALKISRGAAKVDFHSEQEVVYEPNGLTSLKLNLIIEARLNEILFNVREAIRNSLFSWSELPEGIYFTGGVTATRDFMKLAQEAFSSVTVIKAPINRLLFSDPTGLIDFSPSLSVALGGLVLRDEMPVLTFSKGVVETKDPEFEGFGEIARSMDARSTEDRLSELLGDKEGGAEAAKPVEKAASHHEGKKQKSGSRKNSIFSAIGTLFTENELDN